MNKVWKAKYYLEDIIEALQITIDQLALESGLSKAFLIEFLKDDSDIILNAKTDEKLCKATNQPKGYFLEKENLYLQSLNKKN